MKAVRAKALKPKADWDKWKDEDEVPRGEDWSGFGGASFTDGDDSVDQKNGGAAGPGATVRAVNGPQSPPTDRKAMMERLLEGMITAATGGEFAKLPEAMQAFPRPHTHVHIFC